MGKRGPKPEPKSLKLFKGTRFKRPDSVEPPRAATPEPPEWLGLHGRAKWIEVGPHLAAVGLFSEIDNGAFAQYCGAWDEFHDADQQVRESGLTYQSDKGNILVNPAVSIRQKARQAIRQWGNEFGLSPAARVSLPGTAAPEADMEEFKVG